MRVSLFVLGGLCFVMGAVSAGPTVAPPPSLRPLPLAGWGACGAAALWCSRYLVKAGLFTRVTVCEKEFPGFRYAYKTHTSAYKDCGAHFDSVCKLTEPHTKDAATIGVYLDDPKDVPEDKTRYAVGVSIPSGATALEEALKKHGYSVVDLPRSAAVYSNFPMTGLLSILLGVFRVYPKLEEYCKAHNKEPGPCLEVCHLGTERTDYYAVLDHEKVFTLGLQSISEYAKANPKSSK